MKYLGFIPRVLLLGMFLGVSSWAEIADPAVQGEFIVTLDPNFKGQRAMSVEDHLADGVVLVKGDLTELRSQPGVLRIEPNYIVHTWRSGRPPQPPWQPIPPLPPGHPGPPFPPPGPPAPPSPKPPVEEPVPPPPAGSDPEAGRLWGLTKIGAFEAQKLKAGKGVLVAVIDTGIDYKHPDLASNVAGKGFNAITGALDAFDDGGHGSHCAGTIAATVNAIGVVGVAPQAALVGAKFLARSGSGTTADAIKAIEWSISHGASILSNSWGGGGASKALEDVIRKACDKGVVFVAAAGNDNSNNDTRPSYPASYDLPCVISVAATDQNDRFGSFSNWGKSVHVAAPGVDIYSTIPGGKYASYSGTSMATPHVSGLVALMLSGNPKLTPVQIKKILMETANPLGKSLFDTLTFSAFAAETKFVASGRVNALAALKKALE